jgi:hypothetical protein
MPADPAAVLAHQARDSPVQRIERLEVVARDCAEGNAGGGVHYDVDTPNASIVSSPR